MRVRWTVGPDLDGDGYREIFATWIGDDTGKPSLTVAAFSGRDGATLWRWTQPGANFGENKQESPMCWWTPAEDGWPKLVVPVSRAPGGQAATYIFDSADGRLMETLPGVSDPRSARISTATAWRICFTLSHRKAIRGSWPCAAHHRPPGGISIPGRCAVAEDFDGDGIADAIVEAARPRRSRAATGGPCGTPRTAYPIRDRSRHCCRSARPAGLVRLCSEPNRALETVSAVGYQSSGLEAAVFSGDDGHRIWIWPVAGPSNGRIPYGGFTSGNNGTRSYAYPALGVCTLDRARPDVFTAAPDASFAGSPTPSPAQSSAEPICRRHGPLPLEGGCCFRTFRPERPDLSGRISGFEWRRRRQRRRLGASLRSAGGCLAIEGFQRRGRHSALARRPADLWSNAARLECLSRFARGRRSRRQGRGGCRVRSPATYDPKVQGQPSEVVAVEGRTGRVKWTWPWVNSGEVIVPPLLVDFDGSGRHSVCLYVNDVSVTQHITTYQQFIVILDGQGKLRRRVRFNGGSVASAAAQFWSGLSWWRKVAVGSDGKEALLVYDPGSGPAIGTPPARRRRGNTLVEQGQRIAGLGRQTA